MKTNFIVTLSDDFIRKLTLKAREKQISVNDIVIFALNDYFADDSQDDPTSEEIIAMIKEAEEAITAGHTHSIDEVMAMIEADIAYLNDDSIHTTKFVAQLSADLIDLIYTKVDEEDFSADFVVRAALSIYFDEM